MNQTDQILELIKEREIIRPRDLAEHGLHRSALYALYEQGKVIRTGRGLYMLAETDLTENHSLAEVAKRIDHGTICLLSALLFHNIGTQNPPVIWVAIDPKARHPHIDYPPVQIVRFSGESLTAGVEQHAIEGVQVSIYNKAKTIADCFKYRNKIGLDVCLEALNDCIKSKRCNFNELWHYAKICRVANVMRPYLEAMAL